MRIGLIVALFVFVTVPAFAQTPARESTKRTLQPLPRPGKNIMVDRTRCGDYFFYSIDTLGPGAILGFFGHNFFVGGYPVSKVVPIIEANNTPTSEVFYTQDRKIERVILRLSQDNYDKSRACLPPARQ